MATRPGSSGKAGQASKTTKRATASKAAPRDDLRTKFRDALARKQDKRPEKHADGGGKDPNKVHDAQNLTRTQRDFRRKTG